MRKKKDTEPQIELIEQLLSQGWTCYSIAKETGVNRGNMYRYATGEWPMGDKHFYAAQALLKKDCDHCERTHQYNELIEYNGKMICSRCHDAAWDEIKRDELNEFGY